MAGSDPPDDLSPPPGGSDVASGVATVVATGEGGERPSVPPAALLVDLAQLLTTLDRALLDVDVDGVTRTVNQMLLDRPQGALLALRSRLERPTSQAARTQVVLGLIRLGEDALLREVAHALRHEDSSVVVGAARVLGMLRDPRTVPNLLEAIKTEDPAVGRAVIDALGAIGDSVCVPWLVAAAEQGFCVEAACRALGILGDDRARKVLVALQAGTDRTAALWASQALVRLEERTRDDEDTSSVSSSGPDNGGR